MSELKPCPFCGEDAYPDHCDDGITYAEHQRNCGNAILTVSEWQQRPIEDQLRAQLELAESERHDFAMCMEDALHRERETRRLLKIAVEALKRAERDYIFKWSDSKACSVLTPIRETLAKLKEGSDD